MQDKLLFQFQSCLKTRHNWQNTSCPQREVALHSLLNTQVDILKEMLLEESSVDKPLTSDTLKAFDKVSFVSIDANNPL